MTSFSKSLILINAICFILYHECVGDQGCINELYNAGFKSENSRIVNYLQHLTSFAEENSIMNLFRNLSIFPSKNVIASSYFSYLENTIFSMIFSIDNSLKNSGKWCDSRNYEDCFKLLFKKGFQNYSGINNLKELVKKKIKMSSLTGMFSEYAHYLYDEAKKLDDVIYNVEKWCEQNYFNAQYEETIIENDKDDDALFNKILTVESWCTEHKYNNCHNILVKAGFRLNHLAPFNYGVLVIKYDKYCYSIADNNIIRSYCEELQNAFHENIEQGVGDQLKLAYYVNENENE